jgi:hypothetical protein
MVEDTKPTEQELPVDPLEPRIPSIEEADHWMKNFYPGWKNKTATILAAAMPFLYLFGRQFDIQPILDLMNAAPAVWAVALLVLPILQRIGYLFKK